MCAYNFPCILIHYGKANFDDTLMPILERFCKDGDEEVRCIIASGFHEIAQIQQDNPNPKLLTPFLELIGSGTSEIIQQMARNLNKTLPILYKMVKANAQSVKEFDAKKTDTVTNIHLNQILIGCNRLIRNSSSGSWRSHEAYLKNVAVLRHFISVTDLLVTFVPMLNNEVLTARALPCRIAAAQSLLLIMREFPVEKNRKIIIDFFTKTIAEHSSCHRRRLLLDVVPTILEKFSRHFFITHFLPTILKYSEDKVSNIRLQMCQTFSIIKGYLIFPDDDDQMISIENVIRQLLLSEQNSVKFACQLSRVEADPNVNIENQKKLDEEKRLWTEVEAPDSDKASTPVKKIPPKVPKKPVHRSVTESILLEADKLPPQLPPFTGSDDSEIEIRKSESMVKIRTSRRPSRPQMAIVRPQPQVVLVQRSPSPMPMNKASYLLNSGTEEKKSKLPLSTTRYRSQSINSIPPLSGTSADMITSAEKKMTKLKKYKPKTENSTPNDYNTNSLRRSATSSLNYDNMSKSANFSLTQSSSESTINSLRRPGSLFRVQSTSAVERKPSHMTLKVTSMS